MPSKLTSTPTAQTEMKIEQLVRYQLLDKTVTEICDLMGLGEQRINELCRHPYYREVRDRLVGQVYKPLDEAITYRKASQILEDASSDAAEALVQLLKMRDGETGEDGTWHRPPLDPVDVRLTATAVLDRAGCGPIQRRAIRQRIEMDPATVALFAASIRESQRLNAPQDDYTDAEPDGDSTS